MNMNIKLELSNFTEYNTKAIIFYEGNTNYNNNLVNNLEPPQGQKQAVKSL